MPEKIWWEQDLNQMRVTVPFEIAMCILFLPLRNQKCLRKSKTAKKFELRFMSGAVFSGTGLTCICAKVSKIRSNWSEWFSWFCRLYPCLAYASAFENDAIVVFLISSDVLGNLKDTLAGLQPSSFQVRGFFPEFVASINPPLVQRNKKKDKSV